MFKGSIFISFKSEEACQAFVKVEEKYNEALLIKKFQQDYLMEKFKEDEDIKNHGKRGRE